MPDPKMLQDNSVYYEGKESGAMGEGAGGEEKRRFLWKTKKRRRPSASQNLTIRP